MVKKLGWIAAAALAATMVSGQATAQLARVEPWKTLRPTAPLPYTADAGLMGVGDVKLHYAIYGKGQPVVLLHPGLGHSDYWANQVGPLSQNYQVIVIDLRGHGRSTLSDKPFSYGLLAEDVMALMRSLHLGKATIVGWGDGAVVGLELAMRHPGRIGELIAFGATYDLTGQAPGVDKTQTFIDYVHKTAADYARLSPTPQAFDGLFLQMETMWAREPAYTAAQLGEIKVPTTIMIAEHDEWVRREHSEKLAALIPNARMVILPDVSHFAPWQAPKKFNDTVSLVLKY